MKDGSKTKKQLINELDRLQRKLLKYEKFEAGRRQKYDAQHFEHQQLISIFDSIDEPVYVTDPDTYKILYVNQAIKERFGDVAGKKCFRAFQGLKAPCTFCTNNRIFGKNTGKSYIWEFQNKIDQRWYRCIDKAIRWPNGKMVRCEMAIDITEQKKTEEALKEERFKLKEYFENLPLLAYNIGFDGKIQDCNNRVVKTLGYKTKKELIGKHLIPTIYASTSQKKAKQLFLEWKKTGRLKNKELQIMTKNGKSLDILLNVDTIYDKKGSPLYSISTQLDITELKQTEKALRESEERFRKLIDAMPHAVYFKNPQGKNLVVNKAYEKLVGLKKKEILGKTDKELLPPSLAKQCQESDREVFERKKLFHTEESVIDEKGKTIYFDTTKFPLRDEQGNIMGLAGISRDITKQKKAAKTLQESEEKYRTLAENINVGVYRNSPEPKGKFIEANPAIIKMFGYKSKKEFLNIKVSDLYQNPKEREKYDTKISKDGFVRNEELKLMKKNGIPITCSVSAVAVKNEKGNVKYFDGIIEDITERKNAEEALIESLKEKEILLREIHHRVKNNMQIMSSLLNLQSRSIKDRKVIDMFKASQNRIRSMAIIHEKLYLAKDLAGIDFSQYIRSLISHLFHSYKIDPNIIILNTDVRNVTLDINTSIPCGLLINELVSNSLKHAFPKSIGWGKRGKPKGEILLSFRSDEKDQYTLIVRDNGVGLPEELDFRKTKSLGLQLVNDLVGQLNGSIELLKKAGTAFTITFKKPVYKQTI